MTILLKIVMLGWEDLGRHVINVHNEKTYSCAYCEKKFGRTDSLKRHMKSVHFHMP